MGNQENATIEQPDQKSVDPSCQSKPSVSVHRIDRRNKMTSNDILARLSLIPQNSSDLLTDPPSTLATTKTNRIAVIKLPRPSHSFAEYHSTTSIVNIKPLPRQSQHSDLSVSRERRASQRRASTVIVSRIKRSLSVGQTQ